MHRIRRLKAKEPEAQEALDQAELEFLDLCRSFGETDDENETRQIGTVSPSYAIPQCTAPSLVLLENDEDVPSIPPTQSVNSVQQRSRKACERYYERFVSLISLSFVVPTLAGCLYFP